MLLSMVLNDILLAFDATLTFRRRSDDPFQEHCLNCKSCCPKVGQSEYCGKCCRSSYATFPSKKAYGMGPQNLYLCDTIMNNPCEFVTFISIVAIKANPAS